MTREELRKKRQEIAKNNGYSEYNSKKYSQQPVTTKETSESNIISRITTNQMPTTSSVSTWDKVQSKMASSSVSQERLKNTRNLPVTNTQPITQVETKKGNPNSKLNILSKIGNDVKQTVKNTVLGGASGLVSGLGQIEFLSQQKNPEYRKAQAFATKVKEQKELKTGKDIIDYEIKNLENSKIVNGMIMRQQPSINESTTMKVFNKQQEEINKTIEENTEQAQTKLGKFYAGQVAPSMGQSLVGTGLDIVAPRYGCWI